MDISEESLRQRYSQMETDELIELHRTSDLTDLALSVLEIILSERGITAEERKAIGERIDEEPSKLIPLASMGSRFIAQIIDGVVALLLVAPILVINPDAVGMTISVYAVYLLFQDGLPNGQSIGKRVMGIRVVDRSSRKACGFIASFVRNIFLVFLGIIDVLFLGSRLRQRLGDMVANTIVTIVEEDGEIQLKDAEKAVEDVA